jgi:hypothetical protein
MDFPSKNMTRLDKFARNEHSSLFVYSIVDKKVLRHCARCQCHKTFFAFDMQTKKLDCLDMTNFLSLV